MLLFLHFKITEFIETIPFSFLPIKQGEKSQNKIKIIGIKKKKLNNLQKFIFLKIKFYLHLVTVTLI